jgi:hypothetical protein
MNNYAWKEMLQNTPEAAEKVDAGQHQEIMRAVRLAQPTVTKPLFRRAIPAWGAGVFAMLLLGVFFYLPRTEPVNSLPQTAQAQPQVNAPGESLMMLEERFQAFTMEAAVPEQELRKELERLKTDLARFDFRS